MIRRIRRWLGIAPRCKVCGEKYESLHSPPVFVRCWVHSCGQPVCDHAGPVYAGVAPEEG